MVEDTEKQKLYTRQHTLQVGCIKAQPILKSGALIHIPVHVININTEIEIKSKLCPDCVSMTALIVTISSRVTLENEGIPRKEAARAANRKYPR